MMSKSSLFVLLAACVLAVLLVSGCTQPTATTTTATPAATATPTVVATTVATTTVTTPAATAAPANATGAVGMANPASVNCGNVGGKTEIKTNTDGSQYGMCTFPNGTSCEEWALFHGEGCKANVTVAATTTAAVPNATATIK